MSDTMERHAKVDNEFRWWLCRRWDESLPPLIFVMLNPSTADAHVDDPTIRRCIGFAQSKCYGAIGVVNLFPYRATSPADLHAWIKSTDDTYRNMQLMINLEYIKAWCSQLDVVLAWGSHADKYPEQAASVKRVVMSKAKHVFCLGQTKSGQYKHPLYLPSDTEWKLVT
jgi:hypothetical protein